mgnify:CR=1 FL=1
MANGAPKKALLDWKVFFQVMTKKQKIPKIRTRSQETRWKVIQK